MVKCSEVKVIVTGVYHYQKIHRSYAVCCLYGCLVYHILSCSFGSIFCHCVCGCVFCVLLLNVVHLCILIFMLMYPQFVYIFLLCLCTFIVVFMHYYVNVFL